MTRRAISGHGLENSLVVFRGLLTLCGVILVEERRYKDLKTGVSFGGREYFCALDLALELIGGKWKMMMLYHLRNGPLRSSELKRRMRDISAKMFAQTARTLQNDGLIKRTVYPVVPAKVEYALTALGETVVPVIMEIGYWGEAIAEDAAGD